MIEPGSLVSLMWGGGLLALNVLVARELGNPKSRRQIAAVISGTTDAARAYAGLVEGLIVRGVDRAYGLSLPGARKVLIPLTVSYLIALGYVVLATPVKAMLGSEAPPFGVWVMNSFLIFSPDRPIVYSFAIFCTFVALIWLTFVLLQTNKADDRVKGGDLRIIDLISLLGFWFCFTIFVNELEYFSVQFVILIQNQLFSEIYLNMQNKNTRTIISGIVSTSIVLPVFVIYLKYIRLKKYMIYTFWIATISLNITFSILFGKLAFTLSLVAVYVLIPLVNALFDLLSVLVTRELMTGWLHDAAGAVHRKLRLALYIAADLVAAYGCMILTLCAVTSALALYNGAFEGVLRPVQIHPDPAAGARPALDWGGALDAFHADPMGGGFPVMLIVVTTMIPSALHLAFGLIAAALPAVPLRAKVLEVLALPQEEVALFEKGIVLGAVAILLTVTGTAVLAAAFLFNIATDGAVLQALFVEGPYHIASRLHGRLN
ncbi:MAG: hypothetical protein NXI21_09105 [Alphaproteobacteria bacterium]|nr:hypothetical protein [Alphaproteobacteria bacterium]